MSSLSFQPLKMPRKSLTGGAVATAYRVYKTPTDFVTVEADMAMQAIEKSGVQNPYKIVRVGQNLANVLTAEELAAVNTAPVENAS